ncbi:MAG: choice-of-anchor D domain-containing protein [Burkholderiales bacterium]
MSQPFRIRTLAAMALAAMLSLPATAAVTWNRVYSGFTQPVDITTARDGSGRLFVVQQTGQIRVIKGGSVLAAPFLDLSGVTTSSGERGLLGVAFHPQYALNRQFYVNYTRTSDGATVIARYTAPTAASDVADPASAQILLVIAQPYDNHNGGSLRFGADGFLYIGMGDGGSGNDPEGRAQDKTTLLGKILRIDVDHGSPYAIPPGNPFPTGVGGRAEIFAIGLRNPWRISFDRANGDFWIGDVGQGAVEEIDLLPAGTGSGANLGWRVLEGNSCTGNSGPVTCTDPTLTAPVITYTHSVGCSVTGGFVYRGVAVPSLAGQYVYGDFCSGIIWAAQKAGSAWSPAQLGDTTYGISTFGEDETGELYFADYNAGDLYRFADTAPPVTPILALTSTSLNFGNVAVGVTSAAQTITVSNGGGGTLTLASLTLAGAGSRNVEYTRGGTCAAATALSGAQTCTITFTFRPGTTGLRSASLAVASNGGNPTIALSGTGIVPAPAPTLSANATALDFGNVALGASSSTQTMTVTNAGGGTLALASLTPGGANPGDFARTGTCAAGSNLTAGQSCTVIYRFTPTAAGARAATLAVASNGGSATLALSGTGVTAPTGPTLTPSATTQAFGSVFVFTSSPPQTVTLTNTGTGTLTIASLTAGGANPGDFPRTGTCAVGTSLTAGQSCTVTHWFTPMATGARAATLSIGSNGGGATINMTGTGSSGRGG